MLATKDTTATTNNLKTDECTCPTCGAGWLLDDLNACLDYAVQHGNYEDVDMLTALIEQAQSWEVQTA